MKCYIWIMKYPLKPLKHNVHYYMVYYLLVNNSTLSTLVVSKYSVLLLRSGFNEQIESILMCKESLPGIYDVWNILLIVSNLKTWSALWEIPKKAFSRNIQRRDDSQWPSFYHVENYYKFKEMEQLDVFKQN